uniref:FERM domain-containing protein n=1 Tax=Ciona savignyi TaxID=51511 RepID=H2YG04_CIOSA
MADARKCCIYLPNERKLELNVQPKLLGRDLLDIVADHFKLREKEYFGIAYKSEGGHYSWLQNDKRVLDQYVLKKSTSRIDLLFAVKFFVESVKLLKYVTTTELYFLHVKSLVYKGQLEVDNDTAFRLAAYALQTTCGDYVE